MLFTLEALRAQFGDALLLHYGDKKSPKLIVIDGGPAGVYADSLQPRLDQIRKGKPLPIELLMVSHIDGDHIVGINSLTDDLLAAQGQPPYEIIRLWHNSFDDILGNGLQALSAAMDSAVKAASAGGEVPSIFTGKGEQGRNTAAIVATVPEGRTLRDNAKKLGLQVNAPFKGMVKAPKTGKKVVDMGDGLKFTIVGPDEARLEALRVKWDENVEKIQKAKNKKEVERIAADFANPASNSDPSPTNLSSIVVLAEADIGGGKTKTMLLTGDARGDYIYEGLKRAKLLTGGKLHVDLLKIQHHGSDKNVTEKFFSNVTADHYVASGDGITHGNPDIKTLQMLSAGRGQDKFTIHLTYRQKHLQEFFDAEKAAGKKYKVVFRKDKALSVAVKLGE
jgi:beta-lactamase superfamily II metal-dependent hydrolase